MTSKSEGKRDELQTPIAIIGMGCMFPTARNLTEFWRSLRTGRDGISEVPESHWKASDYFDPDPRRPDMTYCTRGGFLAPTQFDPTEFGIPPTILEATDTTQLLGLVAAKAALEDAGYGEHRDFNRDGVSVLVGVTGTQELVLPLSARLGHPIWRKALAQAGVTPEVAEDVVQRIADSYVSWQENSFPGLLGNVVAGRIANRLNLRGTNCVVDAACASSLSAIHLAMLELGAGRSDMALAGGADSLNDIFMYMCFSKTPALSATGDSRPFAADADGTVLGEGVGMVLLKRLDDAERDGDRIYAVIRSIGTSSDGRSQSIYAPHAAGQARCLRAAYKLAGIGPESVELIEAHGTGTRVGDVTEFEALKTVFGETQREGSWCAIGSVKSQIGHTKAAAGVAGLIKAALAIHHRAIPPTIKVREPNPKMGIGESPFYVSTELRPWIAPAGRTRRAGVSAFGFGGSNFHAVLEEHDSALPVPAWDGSVQIIALSAATLSELKSELNDWISLSESDRFSPEALAYEAAQSRATFSTDEEFRLVVVAEEGVALPARLREAATRLDATRGEPTWSITGASFGAGAHDGKLALVFPGQGSQFVKMGRDLACTFPEMISAIAEAESTTGQSIGEFVYPRPVFDESGRSLQAEALTKTDIAQPALGAIELGMFRVLERFGVKPAMTAGHSFGELVALAAAGRYDAATLHRLARLRGRLMAEGEGDRGTMLAVKAPFAELKSLIESQRIDVVIANRNSPSQCVLSGERRAIAAAAEACKTRGFAATPLRVSGAFHSRLMESALQPFRNALEATEFTATETAVFANTTASAYAAPASEARKLLGEQLVRPVDFVGEVEAMYSFGARVFVEVGPRGVVTGLIRDILGDRPHTAIAMDASAGRGSGVGDLALVLARLASLGFAVDLTKWERPVVEPRVAKMAIPLVGANYRNPRKERPPTPARLAVAPAAHEKDSPKTTRSDAGSVPPAAVTVAAPGAPAASSGARESGASTGDRKPASSFTGTTRAPKQPAGEISGQVVSASQHSASQRPTDRPSAMRMDTRVTRDSNLNEQPAKEPANQAMPAPAFQEAMRLVQQGLSAMQRLQQQTAEAHQRFLEGQSQAHQTFQLILEGHQRLMEAAMSGRAPVISPRALPSQSVAGSPMLPEPSAGRVASNSALPVQREVTAPAPVSPVPAANPPSSVTVARQQPAVQLPGLSATSMQSPVRESRPSQPVAGPAPKVEAAKPSSPIAPAVAAQPVQPAAGTHGVDRSMIERSLVEVVCDKTGYPSEMVDLSMDIEADLGVDSIKRVEIIAALEEKIPTFGGVKPEYMGSIRTLIQIVEFIAADVGAETRASSTGGPAGTPGSSDTASGSNGSAASVQSAAIATSAPGIDRGNFSESLLCVVAELTGYPKDMLDLAMDMEADLGIDSIKRVEILAGVEARVPGLPPVKPEYMGSLRTLSQIVDYCVGAEAQPASPPAPAADTQPQALPAQGVNSQTVNRTTGTAATPGKSGSDAAGSASQRRRQLNRRVLTAIELPSATGGALRIGRDREVLVTDDGGELSRQIVSRLDSAGYRARMIPMDADLTGRPNVGALLIVAPKHAIEDGVWRRETENFIKSTFALIKSAGSALQTSASLGGSILATISRMDGAFGLAGGRFDAAQGALAGLVKSAGREWTSVACRAIDVSPSWVDAKSAAAQIIRELGEHGPAEVGLDGVHRRGLELAPGFDAPAGRASLNPGDVVIVTGGARGVTAEAALAIAKRCQPTLVLLGRTSLPEREPAWLAGVESDDDVRRAVRENEFAGRKVTPKELRAATSKYLSRREIRLNLERIRAAGATVEYRDVNVNDAAAVREMLADVQASFGPVRGLIHGAGVIEDRKIENKTPEQFAAVFDTKVAGLRHVLEAIQVNELRAVVMFSSVSGRCGNVGQIDYSAANEVLNKVSQRLAAMLPSARVVSLNWGPWDGGMVHPLLRQEFVNHGLTLIPMDDGAEIVADELSDSVDGGVEVVIGSDFESVTEPHAAGGHAPKAEGDVAAQAETAPAATAPMSAAFERSVDVDTHAFLRSHVIDGHAVVPAAILMEWLAHAAMHANPGLNVQGLDEFRVLKGVVLRDGPAALKFYCARPRRSGDVFDVDVEVRSAGPGPGGEVRHARATVVLTARSVPAPSFETPAGLIDQAYTRGASGAYAEVLFHGQAFHGIQRVEGITNQGLIARVKIGEEPSAWMADPLRSHWLTDPLVVDCAFQAAILWCVEQAGAPCLPSSVRSYRQYRPAFPAGGVSIVLQVRRQDRNRVVYDCAFVDSEGELVARMEGVEGTIDASLQQAFRRREIGGAQAPRAGR